MDKIDNYRHKGLRRQLVAHIRTKGISDEKVLDAIGKIPRHYFVENYLQEKAYIDRALPIESGQTISQPFTVAFQTQLLEIEKGDKILEIGTGSGYQTAVLLEFGAKIFTIERQYLLFKRAERLFTELGYTPFCFYGDGHYGKSTYGPYNKILITAAATAIPDELLQQLRIGGILVAPIGDSESQVMRKVIKISENEYKTSEHGHFLFVPMLKGTSK